MIFGDRYQMLLMKSTLLPLNPLLRLDTWNYISMSFVVFINCFSSFVISSLVYDYITNPSPAARHGRIQLATDLYLRLQTYLREKVNNAYRVSFVID
jgi:hypothetical protein